MNQDCKRSYNSGLFISKSLSQVVIATLWQIKLLGHNYLVYFLITKKASFKIQHTTIYTKQRIQTNTCNPRRLTGLNIALGMQKHLFKCGIIVWKYSPHQAKGFIGASTCYSELTRGIQCHWMQRPSLQAVTIIPVFQNTPFCETHLHLKKGNRQTPNEENILQKRLLVDTWGLAVSIKSSQFVSIWD